VSPLLFSGIALAVLLPELVELSSKILPRSRGKAYLSIMTKQFEDQLVLQLSAEEAASFDESLAQADRGEFATDEQVRAIWAKHGL
jgi:predicted transcriptional regulator